MKESISSINNKDFHSNTDKLRVALVVPNFTWCDWDENTRWRFIPYNLCLLAATVNDIADVRIIDANAQCMNEERFIKEIAEFNPDIVGITVLMDQYKEAGHHAAKLVKRQNKEAVVIIGGVYATMNPVSAINDPNIDYVVIGEGEYVFKELLDYLKGNNSIPDKGVAYKSKGSIINNGHSAFINDLDALPLPAYHLIDLSSYVSTASKRKSIDSPSVFPYARIITSRGCPYGCSFCQVESISGKKFRPRSPENVLNEIQWLRETYNIQSLIFDDDNLYTNKKRAKELFQGMIDRNLVMPWVSISAAAFKIDDELIQLMKSSGCEYINMAVESGSERVLNNIVGKPINLERAKYVAQIAKNVGIYVAANFIIGFPTETWDEIRETIKYAEDIDVDYAKIFALIPLEHTRLWDLCVETNAFKTTFSLEKMRWSTGQISTDDFNSRDLTILRAYEWDRINFSDPVKRRKTADRMNITESELLEIRRKTLYNASHYIDEK